ncbi:peroxidase isoform X2 [Lingula anatina]|nr:peroxidase isoform X2 [Lingula anatina]XP_013400048.1 peroxidase isoform X2 [Lingula anatina]XP_013400049.1 peroxidase isoform X2 [Lingula anatina]XP_013400050.1 peroxidase isoform X2 [Lingula anatina]|eukprot:XP_013400047.1 peroxidase isoform X2 [Lingula anatina]
MLIKMKGRKIFFLSSFVLMLDLCQGGPADQCRNNIRVALAKANEFIQRHIDSERHGGVSGAGSEHAFDIVGSTIKAGNLQTKLLDLQGLLQTEVYRDCFEKFGLSKGETVENVDLDFDSQSVGIQAIPDFEVAGSVGLGRSQVTQSCSSNKTCDANSKYRTITGECNNLQHPTWGESFTPLLRLISADYGDGVGTLRRAKSGADLPNTRTVSHVLHKPVSDADEFATLAVMTFGQFLDHDLDLTPITKLIRDGNKTAKVVCGADNCATGDGDLAACSPVKVLPGDPVAGAKSCFKFVRSSTIALEECRVGPREQPNVITAYLDLSLVYGNKEEEAQSLRDEDASRGKLKMLTHPFNPSLKPLLPTRDFDMCKNANDIVKCFKTGDPRVNEHVGLMSHHTLWAREHNRIEEELHKHNPHWDGERLYQEARKINWAQFQYIVYNEYLPVILGKSTMRKYNLNLLNTGFFSGYNPQSDARISNVFSTSAFRFGHSQIPDTHRRTSVDHRIIGDHKFSTLFNDPTLMYAGNDGGVDAIVLGAIDQKTEHTDHHMSPEVGIHLFAETPSGIGTDLSMLNIQRGRDHGIPGYNYWREYCGGNRATTFAEFGRGPREFRLSASVIAQLQSLYEHPDDVDSWSGGLLETRLPGAKVGPTFACLIGEQFQRLRTGDRFWFENDHAHGFTRDQLNCIRLTSMARIICDNLDNVRTVQPKVFLRAFNDILRTHYQDVFQLLELYEGGDNHRVTCSMIPSLNFEYWRYNSAPGKTDEPMGPSQYNPFMSNFETPFNQWLRRFSGQLRFYA